MPSHPARRKLSSIRLRRQLIRDLRVGLSLADAASRAGVSITTVRREMRRSSWFEYAVARARDGETDPAPIQVVSPELLAPTSKPRAGNRDDAGRARGARPADLLIPATVLALQLVVAAASGGVFAIVAVGVAVVAAVGVALSGVLRTSGRGTMPEIAPAMVAIPAGPAGDEGDRARGSAVQQRPPRDSVAPRHVELSWLKHTISAPDVYRAEPAERHGRDR